MSGARVRVLVVVASRHGATAEIGAALARRDDALALLGLGSVGLETARLDRWSDLDFFAIVAPGAKARYIERLDWLAEAVVLIGVVLGHLGKAVVAGRVGVLLLLVLGAHRRQHLAAARWLLPAVAAGALGFGVLLALL